MTVPSERFNAIINTRNFLRDLLDPKKHPKVPKRTRKEAYWCLRHFPWQYDMERTQKKLPDIWGEPEKTSKE